MLFNTEAFLMMPSTDNGLGSLSCGGKKDCSCGCSNSLGSLGDINSFCSTFGLFCEDPITQTKRDDSNFGGSLTQANKDRATQLALDNVAADIEKNPCLYSETNMGFLESLIKCDLGFGGVGSKINWLLVGGVIFGGALLLKKL